MAPIVLLAALSLAQAGAPPAPKAAPSPPDPIAALEAAMADPIARAEPSVVAIARVKADDEGEETTAVRGKAPPRRPADDPRRLGFGPRIGVERERDPLEQDFLSF